ncbi:MAG TPA: glycosyltransferase family 39 protein [Patescibacteria group bacterium]
MQHFKIKRNWVSVLILTLLGVIGFIIFFVKLESVPKGFYVDEALHGYNAYSILQTGKDEYGKFLPIVFRMYGSYNAPLYIYLTTLPIKIWGLNPYAVRIVASLSGFLSIFVFYFFLKNLKISLVGSLFFAVTPWLVFQSRVGYEVSLAFFLFCAGSLFLWLSLKKSIYLIPSAVFLSFSLYAAYTERFIIPPLILFFFVIFRKKILKKENYKNIIISFAILFLTQIPNLMIVFTPAFFPKSDLMSSSAILSQAEKINIFPKLVAFVLSFLREFLSQYVNYFSPRSLFLSNDLDMPEMTPFYVWMVVPYLIGVVYLWKKRKEDYSKFILLVLLLSPIPAALTKDPLSTHRAMPVVFPISLIIAFGINEVMVFLNKFKPKLLVKSLFVILFLFISLSFFWRSYFVLFINEKARDFSFGFEELSQLIRKDSETHYIVEDQRIKIPYIELAFFMKIDPLIYQKNIDQTIKYNYYSNTKFDPYHQFENVETRGIIWEKDIYKNQILVGDELSISSKQAKEHFLTKVFEIDDPIHRPIFIGYKTNPGLKCASTPNKSVYCNK